MGLMFAGALLAFFAYVIPLADTSVGDSPRDLRDALRAVGTVPP